MKRFMVLYKGPPTPGTQPIKAGGSGSMGSATRSSRSGSPMKDGIVLNPDGSTSDDATGLRGYGLIQAEDRSDAIDLLRDHPLLSLGEWVIEVFEVPRR
jgi:hypothetical protein